MAGGGEGLDRRAKGWRAAANGLLWAGGLARRFFVVGGLRVYGGGRRDEKNPAKRWDENKPWRLFTNSVIRSRDPTILYTFVCKNQTAKTTTKKGFDMCPARKQRDTKN